MFCIHTVLHTHIFVFINNETKFVLLVVPKIEISKKLKTYTSRVKHEFFTSSCGESGGNSVKLVNGFSRQLKKMMG